MIRASDLNFWVWNYIESWTQKRPALKISIHWMKQFCPFRDQLQQLFCGESVTISGYTRSLMSLKTGRLVRCGIA
jgi:hypothetical protein